MVFVSKRLPLRSLLAGFCGVGLALGVGPLTASANSAPNLGAEADSLWNQPQGTRPDSALYPIQSWWDGLTRATAQDRKQRGLQELAQANTDLLNAYSLLQEQRTNPGPHPVAFIDPLLSGVYGFITGVHVKAPVGSLFSWLNDSLVHLEGRGSTDAIIQSMLYDYKAQRAAAGRDLAPAANDAVWVANARRETAMLNRIGALGTPSLGISSLIAATVTEPGTAVNALAQEVAQKPNPKFTLKAGTQAAGRVSADHKGAAESGKQKQKEHAPDKN